MNREIKEHRWTESGASLVEFALVLPVLILVLFGIIDFSLFFYDKHVITNAAREGARRGIISWPADLRDIETGNTEIKSRVIEYAQQYLVTFGAYELTDDDIDITRGSDPFAFGSELVVEVYFEYECCVLPLNLPPIIGKSNMRME